MKMNVSYLLQSNCFVVNRKNMNAIVETKVRCYLFNFMQVFFRQYLIKTNTTTVSLSPHPICDIIIKQLAHF